MEQKKEQKIIINQKIAKKFKTNTCGAPIFLTRGALPGAP
jgi:hypothetical protein